MSKKLKVILVDDHPLVLDGFSALLNHEDDIRVVAIMQDGSNLTDVIKECRPHVVVLDIQMPYNGFKVLADVKAFDPKVPVLMLTGFDDDKNIRLAMEMGAEGFATKSEPFPHVLDAIRQVAMGRLVFPRGAQRWLVQRTDEFEALSPRELEVLNQVANGLTNTEIARSLKVSKNTVSFHLKNIYFKLNVSNRTEATVWYFSHMSSFA